MTLSSVGEVIDDLVRLTPLIGFVLLFSTAMYFRKPITSALNRLDLLKWKKGDHEVTAETPRQPEAPAPGQGDEPPDSDDDEREASKALDATSEADSSLTDERDADSVRRALISAVFASNEIEAQRLRLLLRELEKDPFELKLDEARWHLVRFYAGVEGDSAIESLRRLGDTDEETRGPIYTFVGDGLSHADRPKEAAAAYEVAVEHLDKPDPLARAIAGRAKELAAIGQGDAAEKILKDALLSETHKEARARLWMGLASVYESLDRDEDHALALYRASELSGADTGTRFDAAWALSQADSNFSALTTHLYSQILRFKPDHAAARNNFGWEMDKADLPILAVRNYRKADELGHTLSMSNLAYKYIRAGFAEEAEELLNRASSQRKPHSNVSEATARLASDRKEQAEAQEALQEEGRKLGVFFNNYTEAALAPTPDDLNGSQWSWGANTIIELKNEGGKLRAEWEVASKDQSLEITLQGAAGRAIRKVDTGSYSVKKTHCHLYFNDGASKMVLVEFKDKKAIRHELSRVKP